MSLEQLNIQWFQWINASSHPPALIQDLAYFCAEILIYILAAGIVILWISRPDGKFRAGLLYATLSAGLALTLNQLIGLFYYHARPFELGIGHTLARHVPETSFPSDHGTVFFSIALALLWLTQTRRWGFLILAAGLVVAWSRIYLGIHFPLDMLGAFFISLLAAGVVHLLFPLIEKWLEPAVSRLYQYFVMLLHLPVAWFPLKK